MSLVDMAARDGILGCSNTKLFYSRLGQMYKGQIFNGIAWFVCTIIGYVAFVIPGLLLHLCCVAGAAMGDPYR